MGCLNASFENLSMVVHPNVALTCRANLRQGKYERGASVSKANWDNDNFNLSSIKSKTATNDTL